MEVLRLIVVLCLLVVIWVLFVGVYAVHLPVLWAKDGLWLAMEWLAQDPGSRVDKLRDG